MLFSQNNITTIATVLVFVSKIAGNSWPQLVLPVRKVIVLILVSAFFMIDATTSSISTSDLLCLYYCTSLWDIVNTEVNVRFGEMGTTYFQLFL